MYGSNLRVRGIFYAPCSFMYYNTFTYLHNWGWCWACLLLAAFAFVFIFSDLFVFGIKSFLLCVCARAPTPNKKGIKTDETFCHRIENKLLIRNEDFFSFGRVICSFNILSLSLCFCITPILGCRMHINTIHKGKHRSMPIKIQREKQSIEHGWKWYGGRRVVWKLHKLRNAFRRNQLENHVTQNSWHNNQAKCAFFANTTIHCVRPLKSPAK